MMKHFFNITFIFSSFFALSQNNAKKVEFVGASRSEMSNFSLTSSGSVKDTVTPGQRSSGYALIDLGFKINPNASTEILGMIRVRNSFGGFWGGGVTFDVRQLYLRGVVANAFRYQIGNIDYKLTPYTFYNHNPDQLVQLNSIQKVKKDIVDYETFYSNNNTWRQQGASLDFGLEFSKVLKEIKVNSFIVRLNPSSTNLFERFYGGGNLIIKQSKYFSLGLNHVSAFDLLGTTTSKDAFRNNVSTATYSINFDKTKFSAGLSGESGVSTLYHTSDTTEHLNDYFIDAKLYYKHTKSKIAIDLGYMDIGPDFRSIGAQSKRVDFSRANTIYDRYTNNQIIRPISTFDLNQNSGLYNASISDKIMTYNPIYNNALPYGKATFNRKGLYSNILLSDKNGIVEAKIEAYILSEIRGQGTLNLKKFNLINTNINFDVAKLLKYKKQFNITTGLSYQKTKRSSEFYYEKIDLQSTQVNLGLDFEIAKQLFILAGASIFQANGNELMPLRNSNDIVYDFQEIKVKGKETIYSAGVRFDFSKKIYLAVMYDHLTYSYENIDAYKLNQFYIIYNMKF